MCVLSLSLGREFLRERAGPGAERGAGVCLPTNENERVFRDGFGFRTAPSAT